MSLGPITHKRGYQCSVEEAFTTCTEPVWEPPRRLVHTFTLAQDAANPSEVSVEFSDGLVRFSHRGWTDANESARAKFSDWPLILDRFAKLLPS